MEFFISRRQAMLACLGGALASPRKSKASVDSRSIRPTDSWVVYYGATANDGKLSDFKIIVLDPAYMGSIPACASKGGRTIGYLSFGEVSKSHPWFDFPSDSNVLLEENPSWPGTFRVDVRSRAWKAAIHEGVKRLRAMGFDGLFMDTLDTPPYLESTDSTRFKGMSAAAISLVKSVRRKWPEMPIIMNRGYALLPDLVNEIDAVVTESLMTTYDGANRSYKWIDPNLLSQQIALLEPARRRSPRLPMLSLDYWDPNDPTTIRKIYRLERDLGASPYVGTIALDRIVDPPST